MVRRVRALRNGSHEEPVLEEGEANRVHGATDDVGLHHDGGDGHPALQPVALNEVRGTAGAPRLFTKESAAGVQDASGELLILLWINGVEAIGENGDGMCVVVERGLMGEESTPIAKPLTMLQPASARTPTTLRVTSSPKRDGLRVPMHATERPLE